MCLVDMSELQQLGNNGKAFSKGAESNSSLFFCITDLPDITNSGTPRSSGLFPTATAASIKTSNLVVHIDFLSTLCPSDVPAGRNRLE